MIYLVSSPVGHPEYGDRIGHQPIRAFLYLDDAKAFAVQEAKQHEPTGALNISYDWSRGCEENYTEGEIILSRSYKQMNYPTSEQEVYVITAIPVNAERVADGGAGEGEGE